MMARTYLYPFFRFGSIDPARDGWNPYTYVRNNPVGFVDPEGATVESALNLIREHRDEIRAASQSVNGLVIELEIARVVFQENKNDFNLIRDLDMTAVPLIAGPEVKNVASQLAFLLVDRSGSFGIAEMKTHVAARNLGFNWKNLNGVEKGIIHSKLIDPGEALKLAARELAEIKKEFPNATAVQLVNAYNRGVRHIFKIGDVGLRPEAYLEEIRQALNGEASE